MKRLLFLACALLTPGLGTSQGVSNFVNVGVQYEPTVHEFQIIHHALINNLMIRQSVSPPLEQGILCGTAAPGAHCRALLVPPQIPS